MAKESKGKGLHDGLVNRSPEAVDSSYTYKGGKVDDSPTRKDVGPTITPLGPRSA